jgi:hypothetical protein
MNTFQEWLEQCPVEFDFLSDDSEGQVAYVFFTDNPDKGYIPVIGCDAGGIDDDILNPANHPKIGLQ